jgi:alcohol dehydrogenase YqhD (iron-dependent ADH family)
MENFVYRNPTKIVFGKGTELLAGKEVSYFSKKILLHYGGESAKKTGLFDRVVGSLKESGVEYVELGGVKPNPRLSLVREGISICRDKQLDFILALGGGSVIDSAKAIAAGVTYSGDVWDFYSDKARVEKALPLGAILTIPAAGSESSPGTVVTNEEGWYKRAFNSAHVYPRFSILNPELAFTLPKYQVACGASDMIAHLMERYFTNTQHVELTDRLIEATVKTIVHNVPLVLEKPNDYDAWAEVMWSGTVAHNGWLDTGRMTDWASHNIEHEMSGIYDVAHGAGLAVVFPAWMKYLYKHDINRFAQFANRVWNVDLDHWNPERTALEGILRHEAFFKSIGMPVRLSEMNIDDDRLEEMAAKATSNDTRTLGQFVKLNQKDVFNILTLAK